MGIRRTQLRRGDRRDDRPGGFGRIRADGRPGLLSQRSRWLIVPAEPLALPMLLRLRMRSHREPLVAASVSLNFIDATPAEPIAP